MIPGENYSVSKITTKMKSQMKRISESLIHLDIENTTMIQKQVYII